MKRRKAIAALVLTPAASVAQSTSSGWSDPFARSWLESFKQHWRDSKEYTLAVLDAMPPDSFDTKPNPVQRTFGDQLRHLASANVAYFNAFGLLPVTQGALTADPKTIDKHSPEVEKAGIRKFVVASFDYVAAVLDKMTQADLLRKDVPLFRGAQPHSGTDICMRAYMHTAHHRGQAVVYLRVKEIAPPAWKFEPRGV